MNRPIEKYLNYIEVCDITNFDETKRTFSFFGDGKGDWENIGNCTRKEVIKNYINDCREQIKLAKEYLKTIEG